MIKTKLGIDEILTINLPKRKDRKKSFSERFQTINFDFISAVDGTKLDIKKLIKAGKIGQTQFDPQGSTNKYVIGCGLFDPDIYLDKIIEKQGKKQKKQGFGSFFNWLDQYI